MSKFLSHVIMNMLKETELVVSGRSTHQNFELKNKTQSLYFWVVLMKHTDKMNL